MSSADGTAIRRAAEADALALARLRFEFRASLGQAVETEEAFITRCRDWMTRQLVAGGPWHCWLAEQDGAIVGQIWLQVIEKIPNPLAEAERHGYISNAFVREDLRGRGLGSRLLTAALSYCHDEGVDSAFLWPTPESRRLYERHGFVADGNIMEAAIDGNRRLP